MADTASSLRRSAIAILLCAVLAGCTDDQVALADSLARAHEHLSRRQYPAALEAFEEVLVIDPNHFDARRFKAEIFYNTTRLREAEELLVALREESATDLNVIWGLAMVRKDQMRFAEALGLFESLPLEDRPSVAMAETLTGVDRHDDAANWLGRHLAGNPFDSKPYYLLSKIEFRRGRERQGQFWGDFYRSQRAERSDEDTARGMQHAGNSLEAMLFRARGLCQRGRWFEGLQELTRVVQANDSVPLAFLMIGLIMVDIGNPGAAVEAFDRVLALDPGNPTATQLLVREKAKMKASGGRAQTPLDIAKRSAGMGEHDNARAAALYSAQSNPEDVASLRLVGQFFNRAQDAFVRLWAWRRAVTLAPKDAKLKASLAAELTRQGMKL